MIRRLPKLSSVATATLVVVLLLGAILDWPVAEAHVALTFPPARKYDLDFLDNSRTKAPCGMPKGSLKTSFLAGSTFNVSWHLAYPHRGGFRLEVLDQKEKPILNLTPVPAKGKPFLREDVTAQQYQVSLPKDFTCPDCSIRLTRQADEWGGNYLFWSCADVDIVQRKEYRETCSGHGKFIARCKCEKKYYGNRCEYWDECVDNKDCGLQGTCVDLGGTTQPRKQCYCRLGWFGPGCSKKSPIKSTDIDYTLYKQKNLSPALDVYWRILKEQAEIEVVLKANGTSWVGLGWRPRRLTAECKNFPLISAAAAGGSEAGSAEPEPDAEPEPETSAEPEPASEPEPATEPEPESTAEPSSEPASEPASEPSAEPSSEPGPHPEPEVSAEPEPESTSEPEPSAESTAEPSSEPKAEPKSKKTKRATGDSQPPASEPEPKSEPASEPEPKSEPKSESEPKAETTAKPKPKTTNPWTPRHDFNPMDCTDIVIGTARGETHRVWDYYTRDRSTPRVDTFWGGKSDLTATGGFEVDGTTTIVFRRKLAANEPTDHSIVDDLMHVIWAKGQEPGAYVHSPPSGLEKDSASVRDFYVRDELKYHGHRMQRGVTQINFLEEKKLEPIMAANGTEQATGDGVVVPAAPKSHELDNECKGFWKYPRDCEQDKYNCEYFASWEVTGKGDAVHFHIETNSTQLWTGIGFSKNAKMSQTDAVIGWVDKNGRPFMMDTWINGYSAPKLDENQDLYSASGKIENGLTMLDFTRKRDTGDQSDLAFTEDQCLYIMFPLVGGMFNAVNKKLAKHGTTPIVTDNKVCIKSCPHLFEYLFNESVTPAPDRLAYGASIKLTNLATGFEVPASGTPEYNDLSKSITDSFNGMLKGVGGFHKTDVVNFEKDADGVVVKMNILLNKDGVETNLVDDPAKLEQTIQHLIQNNLSSGKVGVLSVDPEYLDFKSLEYKQPIKNEPSFFEKAGTRLYTILGCIAALVFIAIIQATCTIVKTRRTKRLQNQLIPNSAWKDYSTNTNYAFDNFESDTHKSHHSSKNHRSDRSSGYSNGNSQQTTLQMSHSPNKSQYYEIDRTDGMHRNGGGDHRNGSMHPRAVYDTRAGDRTSYADRAYSLPRPMHQQQQQQQQHHSDSRQQHHQQQQMQRPGSEYYTQDRRTAKRTSHNPAGGDRDRGGSHYATSSVTNGVERNGNGMHYQQASQQPMTESSDLYFTPTQRKYSGEVVRVFVDYNKDKK